MKLLKFDSYEDYVRVQTDANKAKAAKVWVSDRELEQLAAYVRERMPDASFGLCHGARNGYEVVRLKSLLKGLDVLGTDISDAAEEVPGVIQWDFHEVKEEWIGKVDFIYSNSWDHSYDPELLFERWMSCLTENGRCFVHWTRGHSEKGVKGPDCFGLSLEELKTFLEKRYLVETVLHIRDFRKKMTLRRKLKRLICPGAYLKDIYVLVVGRNGG